MKVSELRAKNELYDVLIKEWNFLKASYDGIRELVIRGYIKRHERESEENYIRRLEEIYGFGYSTSIVDLFNFYLFKEPVTRKMESLGDDLLWKLFAEDCNLYGDDLDQFLLWNSRYASVFGHVGILVDKASTPLNTKQEEIENKVYPYLAVYFPTHIFDWEFKRDEFNRPYLAYLKLYDDDGQYRIWTPEKWQIWVEAEQKANIEVRVVKTDKTISPDQQAVLVDEGENPIGTVPFVWLHNVRAAKYPIGKSDISEVARIDTSIVRNLSQGEEVINYAAFPMMRKPMLESGGPGAADMEDDAGVTAILEFDPDKPDSKPDWLEAEAKDPVEAIQNWIDKKVSEIYRSSNAGGMAATEISTQAKSGAALQTEFQLLNSKLVSKAINLEKGESDIIWLWTLWQNQTELFADVQISRSRAYDIENLQQDLDNALTSKTVVHSDTFNKYVQKDIVRDMQPGLTEEEYAVIDEEIDTYVAPVPTVPPDDAFTGPNGEESDEGQIPPGNDEN